MKHNAIDTSNRMPLEDLYNGVKLIRWNIQLFGFSALRKTYYFISYWSFYGNHHCMHWGGNYLNTEITSACVSIVDMELLWELKKAFDIYQLHEPLLSIDHWVNPLNVVPFHLITRWVSSVDISNLEHVN